MKLFKPTINVTRVNYKKIDKPAENVKINE